MVNKKLNIKRVILFIVLLFLVCCLALLGVVAFNLSPVDKNADEILYQVEMGTTLYEVYEDLEQENIVRSALLLKVYSKLTGRSSIDAGVYELGPNKSIPEIVRILSEDNIVSAETVTFTFKEGENVRDLISILGEITDITQEDVISKLNDTAYLDSLINKYWFLTDDIKNEDIYYSLEGYLFPDTYSIYKDANIEDVIAKMLNQMENKLEPYKETIENSDFTVHEFLTLASIIELESAGTANRDTVAGVFLNRLNDGWALESCVTTYYAFNINMGDRDLAMSEIRDCSTKYNTRCSQYKGLPVGPIGNSGLLSLDAVINPEKHNYYFFVSDKNQKLYFTETLSEHERMVRKLQNEGLWYEY